MRTCEVKAGQVWRHWKGNLYQVMCVGTLEANMTPMVIYRSASGEGTIWVRPLIEFLGETYDRATTPSGSVKVLFHPRFELVAESDVPIGNPLDA